MADVNTILSRLGMSEYTNRFHAEGFDTWEVIMDITDSDLKFLGVSLAHRKRLQHEISMARTCLSMHCSLSSECKPLCKNDTSRQKRKYRHHPKADIHGPKRPVSAYASFANDVRKNLGGKHLSFIQIARHVGKRWQMLSSENMNEWKVQAAIARIGYLKDLVNYKQTGEYDEYQRYLVDFELRSSSTHQQPSRRSKSRRSSNNTDDGSFVDWSTSNDQSACPSLSPSLIPFHVDIKLGDRSCEAVTLQQIPHTPEQTYEVPIDMRPQSTSPTQHPPELILEFESETKSTLPQLTSPITLMQSLDLHAQRCWPSSPEPATHPLHSCHSQFTPPIGYSLRRSYFETVLQSPCDDPKTSRVVADRREYLRES